MNTGATPKKVMAFGTFDLFHAGHENYLKQAKELGDQLIVIIARDETVKKIKGHEPAQNENERLKNVRMSGIADKVVLGYKGDKYKVLKKFRPDVLALGYDQFVFTQRLEKTLIDLKMNADIIRLQPYFPQIYKSSLLRKGLQQENEHEPVRIKPLEPKSNALF
ncbi:MAG: adenylyltransferase/cytidyltransferase family protein [Candidatus Gracilibacteria bacterium]